MTSGTLVLAALMRVAAPPPDAAAAFERALASADGALQAGQASVAEARYRAAVVEGWFVLGTLERLQGRLPEARDAFRAAERAQGGDARVRRALAVTLLQMGEAAEAESLLAPLRAAAPSDLELLFALASARLAEGKADAAGTLFADLVKARPLAQTRLLIGRVYGDAGHLPEAQAELRAALKLDPRLRHAHYYLGLFAARQGERTSGLAEAIDEFRQELKVAPGDPLASLELAVALAESRSCDAALPLLEAAARAEPPPARTLYYLGRCQLALDHPQPAAASLGRALERARAQGANAPALRAIEVQLGQALRAAGRADEAAPHFAEAERLSAQGTEAERESLARYLADTGEAGGARMPAVALMEPSPLATLPAAQRDALEERLRGGLARAYLNLGVMKAQARDFAAATSLLEQAASLRPALERVQYSLGVAYFNAREYAKATGPLARALAEQPSDAALRSMLAMAWLESGGYAQAADLLRDDPARATDPALQFAYGLALVRSEHAAEAEQIFSALLQAHGDSPELRVMLGQAHAQQGDYPAAIEALQGALRLNPSVAEAHGTLGLIYLRQGNLEPAETELRAEVQAHPDDARSQQNLAIVLDALQRRGEAITVLKRLLEKRPELADARYLLGKALLAEGDAAEALQHLESAAKASPNDANIRYQLGQAYQKLGKPDQAEKEFAEFRRLKEASRN